jgi:murein peptide amidase A
VSRRPLALLLPGLLLVAAAPVATPPAQAVTQATNARSHPAVVGTRVIGHTVKGRAIGAWRFGQPSSSRKVVIFGAMHGDETGPSRILYNLRDGRKITGADIWVIPHYNPDGSARHTRQNAHKVDLNRNFPYHWKRLTGATNSGPRPASEPETKAVMAFLKEIKPDYVISFHQPLKGVGRTVNRGAGLVRRLHSGLHLPIKSFNCDGVCHGTMTEWYNAHFKGVAVTVEYGQGVSKKVATSIGPRGILRAVGARR